MSERPTLAYIDLLNWIGLYTKGSNELLEGTHLKTAINCDLFTEYGAISKPPGSSRVLSGPFSSGGSPAKMSWLGFYKAPDLDGQILRHVLVAAGTTLQKIETDGSLTELSTGRTEGLFATSAKYRDLLFITNQDPDLIGRGDTLVKYDGNEITNWGLTAPGSQETVIDTFDDASSFAGSNASKSDETTTTQDGTAVKVSKQGTGTTVDLTKTFSSTFSVDTTIANRGQVFIYIPRGQLNNLADTAVEIWVGSDANLSDNYYRFDTEVGALFEGWNPIRLDFNSPTDTVGSPDAAVLQTARFRFNARASGTAVTDIRWDRFITFDKGTAIAAEGGAGSVFTSASVYFYKFTFVNRYGHESNSGPQTVKLTLGSNQASISLTGIPTSSDSQTVARKIYRTVAGGSVFLFHSTIEDNTTTTFSDVTDDTGLSTSIQNPLVGDTSDDNSPPVRAGIVKLWTRTLFLAGDPSSPENVYFSSDSEPESWPTLNVVTLDAKVTAMYETYSGLVIETELGKWQVTGSNPDFQFNKIINNIGCVGRRAAGETRVEGWAVDRDGMRLYDLNNPMKVSEPIRDKFDDDFNKVNIELMHTVGSKRRNLIGMFVADSSGEYKGNNFIYQYPQDNMRQGWWWELQLPTTINPLHVQEIEDANGTFRLYMGGDDGMVYELFDENSKNWVRSNGATEAITTSFTTKWFRPGPLAIEQEFATGRVSPRWLEIRAVGDATTWTALVETAPGPSTTTANASETVTFAFRTNDRLLRLPVGGALTAGEYIRITLTNSDKDVSSRILAVRLLFHATPGQFAVNPGDMNPSA